MHVSLSLLFSWYIENSKSCKARSEPNDHVNLFLNSLKAAGGIASSTLIQEIVIKMITVEVSVKSHIFVVTIRNQAYKNTHIIH